MKHAIPVENMFVLADDTITDTKNTNWESLQMDKFVKVNYSAQHLMKKTSSKLNTVKNNSCQSLLFTLQL